MPNDRLKELFPGLEITNEEIRWKTGEFVHGYKNGLTLDGDFNAEQMRALADWMEQDNANT